MKKSKVLRQKGEGSSVCPQARMKLPTESLSQVVSSLHQVVFKHNHHYFIPIPRGVCRSPREKFLSLVKSQVLPWLLRTMPRSWKALRTHLKLLSYSHLFNIFTYFFMCMNVLPACMYVRHMHDGCAWKSGEGIRSPGTEVTGSELHVYTGNQNWVLGRAACILSHWTNSRATADPSRLRQLDVVFRAFI